jgi:hypothetical protein
MFGGGLVLALYLALPILCGVGAVIVVALTSLQRA